MTYHLIIKEPVDIEITEASYYYENEQALLSYKLLDAIEMALEDIKLNPLGYQIRYGTYRIKLVNPFPYIFIYEVIGKDVIVYQFINARKEPIRRFKK
jgi:hypothetical protein